VIPDPHAKRGHPAHQPDHSGAHSRNSAPRMSRIIVAAGESGSATTEFAPLGKAGFLVSVA